MGIFQFYILTIICTLCAHNLAHSSQTVPVESTSTIQTLSPPMINVDPSTTTLYDLSYQAQYLSGLAANTTLEQLLTSNTMSDQDSQPDRIFGQPGGPSPHWFRLRLRLHENGAAISQPWYIGLINPRLEEVDFYIWTEANNIHHTASGIRRSFSSRSVTDTNMHMQPIPLYSDRDTWIYIRIVSIWEPGFQAPMILLPETLYQQARTKAIIGYTAFYSVLAAMIIYNLFVYVSTRSNTYLYYVLFLTSSWSLVFSTDALDYVLIWPDNLWKEYSSIGIKFTYVIASIWMAFYLQFTREFLGLKKDHPKIDHFFQCSIIAYTIFGPIILLGNQHQILIPAFVLTYLFFYTSIILTALYCTFKKTPSAIYFLVSEIFLVTGSMLKTWSIHADVAPNYWLFYSMHIGIIFEVLTLSLALADRIKRLQEQQQNTQIEILEIAQASNRLKDEFLNTISHELRTPMNGIQGALELAQLENPPKAVEAHLNIAQQSTRKMIEMVDSILRFSEMQSNTLAVNRTPFNLQHTLKPLLQQLQTECSKKNLTCKIQYNQIQPTDFIGDANMLSVVLLKLCDNALKFTEQGSIELHIEQLTADSSIAQLRFQIKDSGIGISNEAQPHIFDSFYQLDGSDSRSYGGLGIGLSVCKNLVELMGGTITVNSTPSIGSCFTIDLPFDTPKTNIECPPKPQESDRETTILVVEDNPVNQAILKGLLKKLGYHVSTANNGVEALQKLEQLQPSIILMDCQMPVMDGFCATKEIRQQEQLRGDAHVPIIAVTANARTDDRQRCLDAGMDDYIKKPVDLEIIRLTLQEWKPKVIVS